MSKAMKKSKSLKSGKYRNTLGVVKHVVARLTEQAVEQGDIEADALSVVEGSVGFGVIAAEANIMHLRAGHAFGPQLISECKRLQLFYAKLLAQMEATIMLDEIDQFAADGE